MTILGGVVVPGITNKGYLNFTTVNVIGSSATVLTAQKIAGTDYAFQVDTATASAVTGLKIASAAEGDTLALSVLSTGTDEDLQLDAKGAGSILLNGIATGIVDVGNGLTVHGQEITIGSRTVASGASADLAGVKWSAGTITLTGGTQVTLAQGYLSLARPTLTDGSAVTVDTYASLYIANSPAAGGSVTLTNAYAIWVDAGNTRLDGNLTVSGGTITVSAAATSVNIADNTSQALKFVGTSTNLLVMDTRNTVTGVVTFAFTGPTITVAGASGTTYSQVSIAAKTLTTSTQTTITALDGLAFTVGTQTVAQSGGAVTVTTASALYLKKVAAGASVTITNNYIINTDVAGCFLTAAGAWTDASSLEHKESIVTVAKGRALSLLDTIRAVEFRYRDGHSDGVDTARFGVIAEEVPDFLATNDHKGVASIHLVGYLLSVVKDLAAEVATLKAAQAT